MNAPEVRESVCGTAVAERRQAALRGERPHGAPAIADASYKRQTRNEGVTEIVAMPGRGHALTIDNGWGAVADVALTFVQRFTDAQPAM
ncbi:MAG TPA: hypothetical protein VLM11_19360 [Streptosporangiaceae bacterium]|nr:hypothetical protein [Streptosporangiaceae bacterium]